MPRFSERLHRRLARVPKQADPTGRMPAAVALVLARTAASDLDVLFIKRAAHPDDPWSGQMALPGGRWDEDDADLLTTAIRETVEETGIALRPQDLIGQLDDLAPVTPVLPPVLVRPFVFLLDTAPKVRPSHEVSSHVWFPLDGLPATERTTVVHVRDRSMTVPAFVLDHEPVWGMTYRIVHSIFELDPSS